MGKATEDLRKEHESIIFVLKVLDKMLQSKKEETESKLSYYGELLYFLRIFADKCHHGKEEEHLFKALVALDIRNEGGPVGVMLAEHAKGREYIAQMGQCLEKKDIRGFEGAAVNYRDLLRQHIDKENGVLFVMADRLIDAHGQELMFEKFEEHEERVIGHGVHERLRGMIDAWAEAFGVE